MDWVKAKMHQARLHRTQIQNQDEVVIPVRQPQKDTGSKINRPSQTYDFTQTLVLLAASFVSGAAIVVLIWSAKVIELDDGSASDRFQSKASVQAQQPVAPAAEYASAKSQPGERGDEVETNTVSQLEILPPPSAGEANTLVDAESTRSGAGIPTEVQTKSIQSTEPTEMQLAESKGNTGSWVVNLASLHEQADAEQFVMKTNAKGVAAETTQVTVRGRQYWRVQVTGFSSSTEAKTKGNEIQDKLGLKNVWIGRR